MVAGERTDRVRLVTLVFRKKGTSFEEFSNYWANERTHSQPCCLDISHPDIIPDAKTFAGIAAAKENLLSYDQVRRALVSVTPHEIRG